MTYHLIFGIAGLILILISFLLNEFSKKVNPETVLYNVLNIFGAGFLTYYSYILAAWPFVILNAIWVIAAIFKLGKFILRNNGY